MGKVRRFVLYALGGLFLIYVLLLTGLYLVQRDFVFPAPEGPAVLPPGFERVALTTADGLTIEAAYRFAEFGKPTVVFFHGNGDNWQGAASATQALAARGFGVLLPDYRGYSGNPGSPSEEGLYEDGRAALRWLEQHVAWNGIVIIGNSVGSGVAVQMALEHKPAALVLISPFASLPQAVGEQLRWVPASLLVRDRFDNLAKIGRIEAPILLLHGTADALIAPHHSDQLAAANPRARLMLIEGAGHELAYLPDAGSREAEWLAETLKLKSD